MFTGLVQELGSVKNIEGTRNAIKLTISANTILEDVKIGDSIAVNGTCLTVVDLHDNCFTADVMPETYKITVLAKLKQGSKVNLERALKVNGRLEGHIVTGHVDSVGLIKHKKKHENAYYITISVDENTARYIVRKGSVAIDGISLTVVEVGINYFTVSLIPHTTAVTTLGFKDVGDLVNVETDILGRYVEKLLTSPGKSEGLTLKKLLDNGF